MLRLVSSRQTLSLCKLKLTGYGIAEVGPLADEHKVWCRVVGRLEGVAHLVVASTVLIMLLHGVGSPGADLDGGSCRVDETPGVAACDVENIDAALVKSPSAVGGSADPSKGSTSTSWQHQKAHRVCMPRG